MILPFTHSYWQNLGLMLYVGKSERKQALLLVREPIYIGITSFENDIAILIKIVNIHAICPSTPTSRNRCYKNTHKHAKVHTRIFTVSTVYEKEILETTNISINRELYIS